MGKEENYLKRELHSLAIQDESLFEFITNFALHGLWFWDLERPENEYFNDQFWYTLGYDPSKMPSSSSAWQGMIDPKDAALAQELVNAHIQDPSEPYRQVLRYIHKQGHDVWIRCIGKVLFKDGQPYRMLGVHIDVSDEIRASADLKKYFEEIRDLVLIGNSQGQVSSVNSYWKDFYKNADALIGKDFFELIVDIGLSTESTLKSIVEFDNRFTWQTKGIKDLEGQAHFFEVTLIYSNRRYFLIAHEISERKSMLHIVRRKQALLDLLLDLSSKFIDSETGAFPQLINQSLENVGGLVKADRAYIFDYNFRQSTTSNTYEWCAPNIEPQIDNLQGVPMEAFPDWLDYHLKGEPMIIPNVNELEESNLKVILESQGIKSLAAVPVLLGKNCLGFVGFDWVNDYVEASYEELQALEVLANMLSHVRSKSEKDTQLLLEHAINKNIIEHIGYPLIVIDKDTKEHVLVNESFEQLTGYKLEELKDFLEPYPYWSAEKEKEKQIFKEVYSGLLPEADLELISKKGRLLPVRVKFHPVFADEVETPLIILGVEDLSEQKAILDEIKRERFFNQELLEKSPLYFLSMDLDFKIAKTNQSARTLLKEIGVEIEQDKGFLNYLKSQAREGFSSQEVIKELSSKDKGMVKIITRLPNDANRFLEWSLARSETNNGLFEILIFGEDVSLRENFITEIEHSRKQLKAAQELALVANFTLNVLRREIEFSDNLVNIIPQKLEASLGLGLEPLAPNRFTTDWSLLWQNTLSKKKSAKFGNWFEFNGKEKFLEFRMHARLSKEGEIQEVFGTIQDLTELKNQERDLQDYRDRLMVKSSLLSNILTINRYLSDENLIWDQVIQKSFALLNKDIQPEAMVYMRANNMQDNPSLSWKYILHKGREVGRDEMPSRLEELKFASETRYNEFMAALLDQGFLISEDEAHWVPFVNLRMHFKHGFKKMTFFPITYNNELQYVWGFIEDEKDPWDKELFDTVLKLSNDISRTYGLRQAYLQNRESVKNYELISDATGAAIWQVNVKKNTFTRGPGFKELLGYEQGTEVFDEAVILDPISEIDRSNFQITLRQLMQGSLDNWQGTLKYKHTQGKVLTLLVSLASLKDSNGNVLSLQGSFIDSPDFLKDSSLLEKAASVTRIAAWELNLSEASFRYTDYLHEILNLQKGFKKDADKTNRWSKIKANVKGSWIPIDEAVAMELKENPQGLQQDYQIQLEDGTYKWLRVKAIPVEDKGGLDSSFMGVIQDITESVLDKQKIVEASHWLEKAQKVGKLGYFLLDNNNGKFEWSVSEVLGDLLEIEAGKTIPFSEWLSLVVPKYQEPIEESVEKAFQSKRSLLKHCEVYSASKRKRLWIELSGEIQERQSDGSPVMLGTIRDITDSMENLKNMDDQNKRLREIAWAQSHLVRAPLTRMHGLLDEINTGQLNEKERQLFFNHFKESIGELDGIVKDVIKKAQILEEDGILTKAFSGSYGKYNEVDVHLVDDDAVIRTLQERIILKSGFVEHVTSHASGKDFMDFIHSGLERNKLIVVLLDLNMPDLNGWDVLDKIKALDLEEQIVVVVTTSSTDNEDLRSSYKYSSVVEYIEKPLNYSKMSRIMNLAPVKEVMKKHKGNP